MEFPSAHTTGEDTGPAEAMAEQLMLRFADRTGITSDGPDRRYLWTDAFAVRNFLGLSRATGRSEYEALALRTVARVHHVLGRFRADDTRKGWLSGLGDEEGGAHPTSGGLRIGKELPERTPGERFEERLEWERDGQYFHYLTQWMQALDQLAWSTRSPVYNLWGRELADAAFRAFTYVEGGRGRRMYWKMSVDLSCPLVPSMGQHDVLDGYVTYLELRRTASELGGAAGPDLGAELAAFRSMLDVQDLATPDPLGIGGLLVNAFRLDRMVRTKVVADDGLLEALLVNAHGGLHEYQPAVSLRYPVTRRLAFRELGLSIGLCAARVMNERTQREVVGNLRRPHFRTVFDALGPYFAAADAINRFWLHPEHQASRTWLEHRDINEVMLATALVPQGVLGLPDAH